MSVRKRVSAKSTTGENRMRESVGGVSINRNSYPANEIYCKKDKIYDLLKNNIDSGKYPDGFKFAREIDFAKQLNVGQITLRSALKRLEDEGLVARIHGKGTFVRRRTHASNNKFMVVVPYSLSIESPSNYILPGIERRCREKNIELVKSSKEFLLNMPLQDALKIKKEYDGIIFMANSILGHEKDYQFIKATGLPAIIPHASSNDYKTTGFAALQTNKREAIVDTIKYLIEKGHSRIGAIFLVDSIHSISLNECRKELAKNGLDNNSQLVAYCKYDENEIKEKIKAMMNIVNPPTAIICHSDFFAIHVYTALRELNIKIPEHVAVMGYAAYPGGELMNPPLSTVDIEFDHVGELAVDILLKSNEWWGHGKAPPYISTPYKIVERKSTQIQRVEKMLSDQLNV